MASIEKRVANDGTITFRVKVRLKGAPVQTATFSRLTDAKIWSEQTAAAIREGRHFKTTEAKKHTVADLINRYLDSVLPDRPKSASARKQQLLWWQSKVGHYLLADLTPALISECKEKIAKGVTQSKKPRTAATVNRYLAALSHALTVAVNEWGWLETNPMRKVSKLKEPRGRTRYLSEDERKKLLTACQESRSKALYTIVVLALSTGMRRGEIVGLKWDDIDLNAGRITITQTKNGEIRVVPLVGLAKEVLQEYSKVRRIDSPLVFPGEDPNQPLKISPAFNRAVKNAGIPNFRFHDLRHSAASYLAMGGATLPEIAAVLGHKTFAMVKRYAHLSESHTASVVEKMNRRIFG